MTANPGTGRADTWLGERLGVPAWHLEADADVAAWRASAQGAAFADVKIRVSDTETVARFTEAGFRLTDTNLTFERPSRSDDTGQGDMGSAPGARQALGTDADAVIAIARDGFSTDRFHADPAIETATADRIKADWAGNFFAGARGDWMVVGEHRDKVAGFLQLLDRDGHLVIDLIAVASNARRQGLAAAMIEHAAANLMPGAPMRVGTQLANTASVRLYESLGFRLTNAEHVLHCHVD